MPVPLDPNDTIAAIASPPGPSLRGIVRVTGPSSWRIVQATFQDATGRPPPRRAELRPGTLGVDGLRIPLPVSIAFWPGPRTYTGQDLVEVHMVGSAPLLGLVLAHCLARGVRLAEPGEFTLRAFLSGRIDLTRAEAVLGVIDAQNPAQLETALEQLAGGLSGPMERLRDHLLDIVAHLEANLDFQEEPDVDPVQLAELVQSLRSDATQLSEFVAQLDHRERADHVPRVVLTGKPNAGKSRLFNSLVGHEAAIVSAHAGTTRDYLTARCLCDGLTIELVDTAGEEPSIDSITGQAQAHRTSQLTIADLVLHCTPCDGEPRSASEHHDRANKLLVVTKCDQLSTVTASDWPTGSFFTSAVNRLGVAELQTAIAQKLRENVHESPTPLGTAARCRGSVQSAEAAIRSAIEALQLGLGEELVAADLRLAIDELGRVIGSIVTDDILDRIFSRFCIGK